MKFYEMNSEDVLKSLETTKQGLTEIEVNKREGESGLNRLAEGKKDAIIVRFLKQLIEPMTIILMVAAGISVVTSIYSGEPFTDVIIILAVVLINAILGVYQESKAEKAIEALQKMSAATSKVIRAGKQVVIHSEHIVPGDIIVLEAGDLVPADARIIENASMKVEEATLTGESVPVNKTEKSLVGGMALSLILTIAVIYVPFLAGAFQFTKISSFEFIVAVGLAITVIPIVEVVKAIKRAK